MFWLALLFYPVVNLHHFSLATFILSLLLIHALIISFSFTLLFAVLHTGFLLQQQRLS